jgi:hypothetical protein
MLVPEAELVPAFHTFLAKTTNSELRMYTQDEEEIVQIHSKF